MRPTERFGTLSRTSGGVEVDAPVGADGVREVGEVGKGGAEGVIDNEVALAVEEAERTPGADVRRKSHARQVRRMRGDNMVEKTMRQMS